MADAPISGLPQTTTVGDNDLILLEQSGVAKKIKGSNWKQYFNANVVSASVNVIQPTQAPSASYNSSTNNLTLSLPSADYIASVIKTGTTGLKDTYTVTTALGYTTTFEVENGGGSPSDDVPATDTPNGSAGNTEKYARSNHSHPLRVTDNNPLKDASPSTAGNGTFYAKWNHQHPLNVPASTDPTPVMDGTAAHGTSDSYARSDHVHPTDTTLANAISAAVPRKKQITLASGTWTGTSSPYSYAITTQISPRTLNTKVDIQPDASAIEQLVNDGVMGLYVQTSGTNNPSIQVKAVGAKPSANITVQVTWYETVTVT